MVTCILHGHDCPYKETKPVDERYILLLSPQATPHLDLHPPAKIWLKLWFHRAGLPIKEIACSSDDAAICALCAGVRHAAAVVADITLRDPHVYLGMALARADNKPVRFIAHERAMVSNALNGVIRYPAEMNLSTTAEKGKLSNFEHDIQVFVAEIKKGLEPPKLPAFDAKRFRKVLEKRPGDRASGERDYLTREWQETLINRCTVSFPEFAQHQQIAAQWHETAIYEPPASLLKIRLSRQDRERSKELLKTPAFRHTLESVIFEISKSELNWTIGLETIFILNENEIDNR